jgi:HD-like signal output (HDOD) protein
MSALPLLNQNDPLADLVSRIEELAVLPHVVFKVLEISGTTDSPASEMEGAIVVDPGFSAKVLALANSAAWGLPTRVGSIRDATMFLGYRTVRNIAMTVGVFDLFVGKNDAESLRRRAWWRHSVDTGVCCRLLALKTRAVAPDEAYTCGLLHLMGKTLLDRFGGPSYEEVAALEARGMPTDEAESEVYGFHHEALAVAAAEKWGFPVPLQQGLRYLREVDDEPAFAAHRACTALGSRLAWLAREGTMAEGAQAQSLVPEWAVARLSIAPGSLDALRDESSSAIAEQGG